MGTLKILILKYGGRVIRIDMNWDSSESSTSIFIGKTTNIRNLDVQGNMSYLPLECGYCPKEGREKTLVLFVIYRFLIFLGTVQL